jgi:hypothetical protein
VKAPLVNSRSVTAGKSNQTVALPSDAWSVSAFDVASIRDYLRYAVESIGAVIALEEKCGNRAPIVRTLERYRDDASALLERLM